MAQDCLDFLRLLWTIQKQSRFLSRTQPCINFSGWFPKQKVTLYFKAWKFLEQQDCPRQKTNSVPKSSKKLGTSTNNEKELVCDVRFRGALWLCSAVQRNVVHSLAQWLFGLFFLILFILLYFSGYHDVSCIVSLVFLPFHQFSLVFPNLVTTICLILRRFHQDARSDDLKVKHSSVDVFMTFGCDWFDYRRPDRREQMSTALSFTTTPWTNVSMSQGLWTCFQSSFPVWTASKPDTGAWWPFACSKKGMRTRLWK